jgi:urease accessory protein
MRRDFWSLSDRDARLITPATVRAELHGDRTVLTDLRAAPPWAPRPLADGRGGGATPGAGAARWARVALVQTAATLLRGDRCGLRVVLGPGARLELVETGATVAHDARGGPAARVRVEVELAEGARLRWLGRPLVLAAGCAVERETTVTLAAGAVALLRETVVLGRSGERPGALSSTLRAVHAGRPLLHERIDAGPLTSPLVAGDASVVDAVLLLGARGTDLPGASQLAGPGTLWRALHRRDVDPDHPARAVADAWAAELISS